MLNTGLIIIGIFILAAGWLFEYNSRAKQQKSKKLHVTGTIVGLLVIVFANSFTIIPTGYSGVVTFFGQIREETVPNGFNFHLPFVEQVKQVCNKQQDITFNGQ